MSDAPISDKEYQQALDDVVDLMRGMNRAVPKMHPEDIEILIDGGRQGDGDA